MSELTRAQVKQYFETGDRPTQSQFGDLIDSAKWYDEGGDPMADLYDFLGNTIKAEPVGVSLLRATNAFNMTDQQIRFFVVRVREAGTITGAEFPISTQGNYTAANYNGFGLYTLDPSTGLLTQVASTPDDGNLFKGATGSMVQKAFTTPYTAAAGFYYIALLHCRSAVVTSPVIPGNQSVGAAVVMESGFLNNNKVCATLSTQTSLPSSVNMSALTRAGQVPYIRLY